MANRASKKEGKKHSILSRWTRLFASAAIDKVQRSIKPFRQLVRSDPLPTLLFIRRISEANPGHGHYRARQFFPLLKLQGTTARVASKFHDAWLVSDCGPFQFRRNNGRRFNQMALSSFFFSFFRDWHRAIWSWSSARTHEEHVVNIARNSQTVTMLSKRPLVSDESKTGSRYYGLLSTSTLNVAIWPRYSSLSTYSEIFISHRLLVNRVLPPSLEIHRTPQTILKGRNFDVGVERSKVVWRKRLQGDTGNKDQYIPLPIKKLKVRPSRFVSTQTRL